MKPKAIYFIVGILLLLVLTNPSRNAFMSYLHKSSTKHIGRDYNLLLVSIYSQEVNSRKESYVGLLGNFIPLNKREAIELVNDSVAVDTASLMWVDETRGDTSVPTELDVFGDISTEETPHKKDTGANPFLESLRKFKKEREKNK